jgi:hypothetical protein
MNRNKRRILRRGADSFLKLREDTEWGVSKLISKGRYATRSVELDRHDPRIHPQPVRGLFQSGMSWDNYGNGQAMLF